MRTGTFNGAAAAAGHPERRFRRIAFDHQPTLDDIGLERVIRRFPFVPNDPARLDEDCYEAFNIQVEGLARGFQAHSGNHMLIVVSGGLDSTAAVTVGATACDLSGLPAWMFFGA